jgi:enoyl-CoA hydratase/carnithine racemase
VASVGTMTATPSDARPDSPAGPRELPGHPLATAVSPDADHLRVRVWDDGVVLVELHNPERRNAMSDRMTAAWTATMAALRADRDVRAVVVTGAPPAFCSGGDTGWIGSEPDATVADLRDRMLAFYRAWLSVRDLEVPTIAAVNGAAVGAGAALALACDLRYASASARFSVPFATLGMHPGMLTTWLLPEVVGVAAARDLLLTGRRIDADEMLRLGLVSSVSGDDGFLDGVLHLAHQVAAAAPVALRLTKVALREGGHASYAAATEWEALAQPVTLATADLQEGLAAAREKRPPRFTGR